MTVELKLYGFKPYSYTLTNKIISLIMTTMTLIGNDTHKAEVW